MARHADAEGGVLMLRDVDFGFLDNKAVPVNITMPALSSIEQKQSPIL